MYLVLVQMLSLWQMSFDIQGLEKSAVTKKKTQIDQNWALLSKKSRNWLLKCKNPEIGELNGIFTDGQ